MIINSILDNDLYKFSMMQAVLHQHPDAYVKYKLINRDTSIFKLAGIKDELVSEINNMGKLFLTKEEADYLLSLDYIKNGFVEFLEYFKFDTSMVKVNIDKNDPNQIEIFIEGPWVDTILYEVPVLAIINEIVNKRRGGEALFNNGVKNFLKKADIIKQLNDDEFQITEFGTRRRFSFKWHEKLIVLSQENLKSQMQRTSNVYLAKKYNLIPSGTMAHEWIQAHQALGAKLTDHQNDALECWVKEYRGDLGIALTDTISMDAFLNEFDLYLAKLYDGCRQDSGDPYEWGEKLIAHYKKLKIDPKSKFMMFSDSLNIPKAIDIYKYFKGRIKIGFGIGTNLTNDLDVTPLNIVIKMIECNGQPVAKISDTPGKTIIKDEKYLNYLKNVFNIQE